MPRGIVVVEPEVITPTSVGSGSHQDRDVDSEVLVGMPKEEKVEEPKKVEEPPKTEPEVPQKRSEPGEGIDEKLAKLRESLGYVPRKKPTEKTKEEEVKPEEKPKEEPKKEEPPKEEPKKVEEPKPEPAMSARELADIAASSAARAAVEATRPREEKPAAVAPTIPDDISGEDRKNFEVFQRLEKDNPEKYRGISTQYTKYLRALDSYQTKWEEAHPGEEFDMDSKEHESFFAKNEPSYSQSDFEDARVNMRIEDARKRWDEEHDRKMSEMSTKVAEIELGPRIQATVSESVGNFVKNVDPESFKTLSEKGVDALREADPIAFDVMNQVSASLQMAIAEVEKLSHPSKSFRFDPSNQVHQNLNQFATMTEQKIKSKPMHEQIKDGKLFASMAEMARIPDDQKHRYWTLSFEMLKGEIVKDAAESAKKIIAGEREKVERYMKARGLSVAKTPDKPKDEKKAEVPETHVLKPKSPSANTERVSSPNMDFGKVEVGPAVKNLMETMFPK